MDTCRTCRWFRENVDDRTIGVGACRVDPPPMIERMMVLSSSALDVAKMKLVFAQHASRTGEILPPLGAEAAERFFKERAR